MKNCSPLGSSDSSSGASWDKRQHKVADLQPAWVRSGETLVTTIPPLSLKYFKDIQVAYMPVHVIFGKWEEAE